MQGSQSKQRPTRWLVTIVTPRPETAPQYDGYLEAAANAQAHAIVTYNLRDFGPAKLFGIPVLNPEQTFQHFGLAVTRSSKP